MQFAYGPDMPLDHLAAVQTLSGTGACRLGGEFLANFWPNHPIYVPDPTWGVSRSGNAHALGNN